MQSWVSRESLVVISAVVFAGLLLQRPRRRLRTVSSFSSSSDSSALSFTPPSTGSAVLTTLSALVDWNERFHHIDFKVYFTNHLNHGLVALYRLGASAQNLEFYARTYATRLEPAHAMSAELSLETWRGLLGQFREFPALKAFFASELERAGGDCLALVRVYFPQLSAGMAGRALHPTVHLGLGLDILEDCQEAGSQMVVEGLAYQTFAFLNCRDSAALRAQLWGQADAPEIPALRVRGEEDDRPIGPLEFVQFLLEGFGELGKWVADQADLARYKELNLGAFQSKMLVVADCFCGKQGPLSRLVGRLDFLSASEGHVTHSQRRAEWTAFTTVLVTVGYLVSDNAFFMLHGVTLWFALRKVLMHLPDLPWVDAMSAFYLSWAAAFMALEFPGSQHPWLQAALEQNSLIPMLEILVEELKLCQSQTDVFEWESLKRLGRESTLRQTDEHPAKLVYVCWHDSQDSALGEVFFASQRLAKDHKGFNLTQVSTGLDALFRLTAASTVTTSTGSETKSSSTSSQVPLYQVPPEPSSGLTRPKTSASTCETRFQKKNVREWT
eukprot:gb/GEZN01005652.1/.p1 GENE.gb/GEZN01005652.1/~~gb/GEZN01005652.1/.p1  ORF type:complete len:556 (-),score=78.47 gb/GEZN01005652.1/:84-1751(-)